MYSRKTAVAAAGERGGARALELDVAADAVPIDDLAEQDRSSVAELGHELPELVAGIGHGDGVGSIRNRLPGQDFGALGGLQGGRIEPELDRQGPVQLDQPGGSNRGRRDAGEEAVRQRRIGVLEGEMDGHGGKDRRRTPDGKGLRPNRPKMGLPGAKQPVPLVAALGLVG
jgi:hypothetical protein